MDKKLFLILLMACLAGMVVSDTPPVRTYMPVFMSRDVLDNSVRYAAVQHLYILVWIHRICINDRREIRVWNKMILNKKE